MNPDFDYDSGEAIVVSSFYSSPNGKRAVRAYEIVNTNPYRSKLNKYELNEPRIEVTLTQIWSKIRSFFISSNRVSEYPAKRLQRNELKDKKANINKEMAFHTKRDGGIVAVASLDLSNKNGDNSTLKEFAQRKAIIDKMNPKATTKNNIQVKPAVPLVINRNIY
ncbi:unnamed protein product [Brachionus calyciflorus]|uniref:Uncharacterized protein n=1 Tax=Brachionus calyciflorus TaxID=104777 RepID=A0A813VQQ2_9BILA|nr:unnamed protein product [Brachionus calyciflorus]